jgi:thiol-disulfide isomerase/thioredoxin
MQKLTVILVLGLVILAGYKKCTGRENNWLDFSVLNSQAEVNACKMESYCIVVYVAPWCPACSSFVSLYRSQTALFKKKGLGILFVIGAEESKQKKEDLRNALLEVAVIDTENDDFLKIHKVRKFPQFWVVDKNGIVLKEDHAAIKFVNKVLNQN